MSHSKLVPNGTYKFDHPTLGSLTGIARGPLVVQFRGIPYARVPARFRQCKPVETLSPSERDCTEYGYACPQVPYGYAALGGMLPGEKDIQYDEFKCLSVTVTVPKHLLDKAGEVRKVPAMVYVHGGAFSGGQHSDDFQGKSTPNIPLMSVANDQIDTAPMVNMSVAEKLPVIIVSIHYRVNWLGFLTCQDLIDEARSLGEEPCNFGLHDQRMAFLWIHKYISGFGGNEKEITAFGESAGSVSLGLQMCSTVPLFKRVILQSGTPSTGAPVTDMKVKEREYRALLKYCGIKEDDPDRMRKLRDEVPIKQLASAIQGLGMQTFTPWAEKGFFPVVPTYFTETNIFKNCSWVEQIVIGDCTFEGYMYSAMLRNVHVDQFRSYLERTLGAEGTSKMMKLYSISADMDPNLFWTKLTVLVGDLMFSQPTHMLATSLARSSKSASLSPLTSPEKKIYRYTVGLRNPFPGSPYYSVAGHHFVDLLYLFMTFIERYPNPSQVETSKEFALRWVRFGNGLEPWAEHTADEEMIAVVEPGLGWSVRSKIDDMAAGKLDEDGGRRYDAWEAINEIFSSLEESSREDVLESLKAPNITVL